MKLALFFIVSTTLHALALTSPIAFLEPSVQPSIPVTILSHGDGGADRPTASRSKDNKRGSIRRQSPSKTNLFRAPRVEARNSIEQTNHAAPIDATPVAEEAGIISLSVNSNPSLGTGTPAGVGSHYNGMGDGAGGSGNSGNGVESGHGRGTGGAGVPLVQASYGYAPKPEYPHSARSAGKEGRVLLRVLVDAQGKTKTVEVNLGSGSDALDRAAVDAIRRWRFSPARHGDQPVESWVRIPIDFRLTDTRD
jgi:TonB family protein